MLNSGEEIPEADRDLFEYFATHYKNSNKGIKGRGKARTVAERKAKSKSTSGSKAKSGDSKSPVPVAAPAAVPAPTVTPQFPLPQIPPPQQAHPNQQHHGVSHPGSLAAYSMSRNHANLMNNMQRGHHAGGYDMFEMDGEHHPVQTSNAGGLMYENEHARDMGFERMY